MAIQSNYGQIVLFDGDDHRSELFGDIEQLSKVPSYCEFYIYCNETDPIGDKIVKHFYDIPQVRLRRSSDSVSQRILHFLQTESNQYSSILIVCGRNPIYQHEFYNIWRKHGYKKLFVKSMNNQSDITVKDILDQIHQQRGKETDPTPISNDTQVFANYLCPQCSKLFYSNDDLQEHKKNSHGSFSSKDLYMESSADIASNKKTIQVHKLIVESVHLCQLCEKDFQSFETLEKHIENEHPDYTLDYFE